MMSWPYWSWTRKSTNNSESHERSFKDVLEYKHTCRSQQENSAFMDGGRLDNWMKCENVILSRESAGHTRVTPLKHATQKNGHKNSVSEGCTHASYCLFYMFSTSYDQLLIDETKRKSQESTGNTKSRVSTILQSGLVESCADFKSLFLSGWG